MVREHIDVLGSPYACSRKRWAAEDQPHSVGGFAHSRVLAPTVLKAGKFFRTAPGLPSCKQVPDESLHTVKHLPHNTVAAQTAGGGLWRRRLLIKPFFLRDVAVQGARDFAPVCHVSPFERCTPGGPKPTQGLLNLTDRSCCCKCARLPQLSQERRRPSSGVQHACPLVCPCKQAGGWCKRKVRAGPAHKVCHGARPPHGAPIWLANCLADDCCKACRNGLVEVTLPQGGAPRKPHAAHRICQSCRPLTRG
mmetsp:Transcript_61406/g.173438  ORF Transcript_61406/g.173438 Transcript_61406/m.173438 type:complete len:251 (-) Transcript_61406:918-1670(-)